MKAEDYRKKEADSALGGFVFGLCLMALAKFLIL